MNYIEQFIRVCNTVAREKDMQKLLELILDSAMEMAECDAGTLYIVQNDQLQFQVIRNREIPALNSSDPRLFPPVPVSSRSNICSLALQEGIINIPDAHCCKQYNLQGTIDYDSRTGYCTRSVLVIPVVTKDGNREGVLQLINCTDPETGFVIEFPQERIELLEAMASQVSIVLQDARYRHELERIRKPAAELDAAGVPEQLSQFLVQNYYGTLSGQELERAIAAESDPHIRQELAQKQLRQQQDNSLPFYPAEDPGEAARQMAGLLAQQQLPSALELLRDYVYQSSQSSTELAARANMYKGTFSGILAGKRPLKKHNICAIAIALGLTLAQTEELLHRNGETFQGCSRIDLILQYFLRYNETARKPYDVPSINLILNEMGEKLLGIDVR